jgi:uncharacterized protein YggT (Ycf19 family)
MTNYQQVSTTQQEPGREQRQFTFQATQLIWLAFGLLEGLIGLRIFLKLVGANAASPFASLLYRFTDLFLMPFVGLTGTPAAGGLVLEVSSIIAMIVYALVAWVLERVVGVIFYRPRTGAVRTQTITQEGRTP